MATKGAWNKGLVLQIKGQYQDVLEQNPRLLASLSLFKLTQEEKNPQRPRKSQALWRGLTMASWVPLICKAEDLFSGRLLCACLLRSNESISSQVNSVCFVWEVPCSNLWVQYFLLAFNSLTVTGNEPYQDLQFTAYLVRKCFYIYIPLSIVSGLENVLCFTRRNNPFSVFL